MVEKIPGPANANSKEQGPPIMWQTGISVLFKPSSFFAALPVDNNIRPPLIFLATVQIAVFVLGNLELLVLNPAAPRPSFLGGVILFVPLIGLLDFVVVWVLHLLAKLLGGKGTLAATVQVFCYASVTGVLQLIPYIGGFLSVFWWIYVIFIGLKKAQGLNAWCAGLTAMTPLMVVVLIFAGVYFKTKAFLVENKDRFESYAQVRLNTLATALEKYAQDHEGNYPDDVQDLTRGETPYWKTDICGQQKDGYLYKCILDPQGYTVTATPLISGSSGVTRLTITTGGIIAAP